MIKLREKASFRLLAEYHSFLLKGEIKGIETEKLCKFPSPYGVSFILILWCRSTDKNCIGRQFPSPYGVSFILIHYITVL